MANRGGTELMPRNLVTVTGLPEMVGQACRSTDCCHPRRDMNGTL
jgi:hypothetical protein